MNKLLAKMQATMDDYCETLHYPAPEEIEKWDESQVVRGKTTPESNSGSFAPKGFVHKDTLVPELRAEYKALANKYDPKNGLSEADGNRFTEVGKLIRAAENDWDDAMTAAVTSGQLSLEEANRLRYSVDNSMNGSLKPLPQDLWHVTTAAHLIEQSGLKTRHQLKEDFTPGLGGGHDYALSFSESESYANLIRDTLLLGRDVARGDVSLRDLHDQAARGEGASREWLSNLKHHFGRGNEETYNQIFNDTRHVSVFEATKAGIKYEGGQPTNIPAGWKKVDNYNFIRPATKQESEDAKESYFKAWLAYRGSAGGPEDPVIAFANWEKLKNLPDSAIGVVHVKPKPGAKGWFYPAEHEYRTHPSAVSIARIRKWDETQVYRAKTTEKSTPGSFAPKQGTLGFRDTTLTSRQPFRKHKLWKVKTAGNKPPALPPAQEKALAARAEMFREEDIENLSYIDPSGKVIATASGDTNKVGLNTMQAAQVGKAAKDSGDNLVSIHNHPSKDDLPYPPSLADLRVFMSTNQREMRVVCQDGTIYKLMRGVDGLPLKDNGASLNLVAKEIEREINVVMSKHLFKDTSPNPPDVQFRLLGTRGERKVNDYAMLSQHMRMLRLAEKMPTHFYYERIDP